MKYIDADRLRAEIELRLDELNPKIGMFGDRPLRAVNPKTFPRERELEKVLDLINSLQQEQMDVDLDALVNEAFDKYSSVDGYGQLSATFNRAELYSFIKKLIIVKAE